jgi:hypothetical protein
MRIRCTHQTRFDRWCNNRFIEIRWCGDRFDFLYCRADHCQRRNKLRRRDGRRPTHQIRIIAFKRDQHIRIAHLAKSTRERKAVSRQINQREKGGQSPNECEQKNARRAILVVQLNELCATGTFSYCA